VPYVRLSLFIATRWKPLPPRHCCGTQAHRHSFCCSCPQRPFAKRGYGVHLYHRYPASSVTLINSFRFRTIGLYGKSLSFRADPDCPSELPHFTLRLLFHMPPSLPRRAVSLQLSVSSRDASAFAHTAGARHPLHCPRHLPLVSQRAGIVPRLQCSLYATACRIVRPTEMAPSAFTRVWVLLLPSFPVFGHPPTSRI